MTHTGEKHIGTKWGSDWKRKIFFYYTEPRQGKGFSMGELPRWYKDALDQSITDVWRYKSPLTKFQLTDFIFHHSFVVFQTESYYWSVEKDGEGIVIQIYKELHYVRSRNCTGERRNKVTDISHSQGSITVNRLIDYLENQEQHNSYYFLDRDSNCQGFATRVFNFIITSTAPSGSVWGLMWTSWISFYLPYDKAYRMHEVWTIFNFNEPIIQLWKYTLPSKWYKLMDPPRYVVFRTKSNYWSIEKCLIPKNLTNDEIVIQISDNEDKVVSYNTNRTRRNDPVIVEHYDVPSSRHFTVIDLLDYIYKNELLRVVEYTPPGEFADRVYFKITST